ncbi:xanthine dehydrogenase family protein molybdopterin-binding subunit [Acuticoccus sp. MNP-M23]|uniref:xanthine dehydrogenase family protein molybdopterin-binding subunit n=1 Tax=Acuticoccus sp. MNP-M23 TaxID=3072793 RepID=UPI0028155A78|nr:xanthine dehydrogenase family protein molybdopterin-binding subunit [Acuticoccus sp. MNP-M23]WMS44824.1 xanthine dehydrogenase family protein molybdopterin-binding subunit [Acuticoccus sp. MNP-M23]
MGIEGIGARALRKEDKRFITGQGRYTDDISERDLTAGVFLRSPHAHAKITKLDISEAEKMPGVVGIIVGQDLIDGAVGNIICGWMIHSKDGTPMKAAPWRPMDADTVRHVGQPVALVVAETRSQAVDAAEAIDIVYDELPSLTDFAHAMDDGAVQVHDEAPNNLICDWELGDEAATDAAFSSAAHVVELDLFQNRLVPSAIEPRSAVASYDRAEEHFTLNTTSQNPHVARLVLSAFYNIAPEHKLRVIAPDVGGGFGSKIYVYPEEICCLYAAKKLGRAIKWTADRTEAFMTDAHGRDHATKVKLALDADHNFTGLKVVTIANIGAYMSLFSSATPTYLYATLLSGQYKTPNVYANVKLVYSHTTPVDAYRGAGRPEATFVVERIVEAAARQLGVSSVELRRKNFIRDFPYQTPVLMAYDPTDFDALLDKGLAAIDYDGFAARKAEAERRGKLRGLGFSCYIEACGLAPSKAVGQLGGGVGQWESAEVRVNPVGTIELLTGSHSHGQGHETTFAQVIADRFGLPINNVQIVHGDTDKVQFGMGTYGSRSGPVGMGAISRAVDKVEKKAKKLAGHLLEADENDIVIENGELKVAGTDKKLAWHEMTLGAYTAHNIPDDMEPGLSEKAFYDPANFTFPAGTFICEVEIDPGTGVTEVINFVAVDDFGVIINPMIVEGQVHGGLAQGIGQALLEGCIYDDNGQLITASYMDYCVPRADDLPNFSLGHIETPNPNNPLGVKGCGEAGAIGAPAAVINAVTDAIGTEDMTMPATPEKVWRAINANRPAMAAE